MFGWGEYVEKKQTGGDWWTGKKGRKVEIGKREEVESKRKNHENQKKIRFSNRLKKGGGEKTGGQGGLEIRGVKGKKFKCTGSQNKF